VQVVEVVVVEYRPTAHSVHDPVGHTAGHSGGRKISSRITRMCEADGTAANVTPNRRSYLQALWKTDPRRSLSKTTPRRTQTVPTHTWRRGGLPRWTLQGMRTLHCSCHCTLQPANPARRRTCRLGSPCRCWRQSSTSTAPRYTLCTPLYHKTRQPRQHMQHQTKCTCPCRFRKQTPLREHPTWTTNTTKHSAVYLQALWRTDPERSQSTLSPRPPRNGLMHTWR
jgi:hypothetical protein